jgi:serine/threonine-protein kinase
MQAGQQFGPFTIDKELGSGAMGTVYRGRYTKTGQVMALKVMAPGLGTSNAAAVDRFEREITILKQLNHPNIVRLYGAGKQQGARYFAMEYVEGESLDKVMARRGRMTWEEVVALGQQLCSALQHAHQQGVIHRDLKPSNIMVLPDGTLKLTDFGIAKGTDMEALTATNCTVGTASYMSPEQCKGERDLTYKSDLYSLGVLFYELLTGRKPFTADNAMEMFLQHVQGSFERPSRLVLDIPVWLDTLVCQLLEKKPEQRPLDAHMVLNTLNTIQEKVEAQQSAGVEAVRRRLIDRAPGQKRPDEEDKEAARILMTGKGKSRRKRAKKIYERIWFRATGLVLALAVVGTLLYLVFRPPSPDKLYQQAERLMKSANEEDHEKAYDGPITEYFKRRYDKRPGPQTEQIQAWADAVLVKRGEDKLRKLREMTSKNLPFRPQEGEGEDKPFAAALAEDKGDVERARTLWEEAKEGGSKRWSLVAQKHLAMLDDIEKQDGVFKQVHEMMGNTGEEPTLESTPKHAFLAWRAEHFGDRVRARTLFEKLKGEIAEEAVKDFRQHSWYVYAAWKDRKLSEKGPKETDRKELISGKLKDVQAKMEARDYREALRNCLDILALYEKDTECEEFVKQASELREKIDALLGRKRPS